MAHPHTLPLFSLLSILISFAVLPSHSIHFQIPAFNPGDANILYRGSAAPRDGEVDFNDNDLYTCQVGWATYSQRVPLWDSKTSRVTDFTTRYTFIIDTQNAKNYGHGLAFFIAPLDFEIPPNSSGGFLGLFNTTTRAYSPHNRIVLVEFDSYPNSEWGETVQHVGINNNSISSSVWTPWNASLHSGDIADVSISYNSATRNLSVTWKYQNTSVPGERGSLSLPIDLTKVLPEWVTVGFSASTGARGELHNLLSWEFNSTLDTDVRDSSNKTTLVVIVTVSCSVLLVAAALASYALLRRKRKRKNQRSKKDEAMNLTSINDDLERGAGPRRYSHKELALATANFSKDRTLGKGGFGAVYRGYFPDLDLPVAVKKISRGSKQGKKEYVTEVKVISQLRHRNLVQLLGWCHDKGEFLLVYEFMPNGSLDTHLFGGGHKRLPWSVRHKISLGLASAVLYLHEEWERCVVHRDIKSSNVMLDSSFNVKLGDFGLAKLMDHELGPQTTGLAGTLGYLAPEYVSTGRASKESDVYSFGVVALEIATGKKAVDVMGGVDCEKGMVEWVWDHYGRGELLAVMDEGLERGFDEREAECLMVVGLWCAHPDGNLRPSIRHAIQVLNFEAALPSLPTKRPVATYHAPTATPYEVGSVQESITTSLHAGR